MERILLVLAVMPLVALAAACGGDGNRTDSTEDDAAIRTQQPLADNGVAEPTNTPERGEEGASLGDTVTLEADALPQVFGYEGLQGSITVTFERVRTAPAISDEYYPCDGGAQARGIFVVVYYTITNDTTGAIQPSSHVGNGLALTDSEGRSWTPTHEGCAVQSNAAAEGGCEQPALDLPAGFDDCTAVTFDVPTDAGGLRLEWEEARVTINLER